MKHALILNVLIIAVVTAAIWITGNPLALLALLLLKEMPYGLLVTQPVAEQDEPQIGFTANV